MTASFLCQARVFLLLGEPTATMAFSMMEANNNPIEDGLVFGDIGSA